MFWKKTNTDHRRSSNIFVDARTKRAVHQMQQTRKLIERLSNIFVGENEDKMKIRGVVRCDI